MWTRVINLSSAAAEPVGLQTKSWCGGDDSFEAQLQTNRGVEDRALRGSNSEQAA